MSISLPLLAKSPPSCGELSSTKSTFASFVLAIAALASTFVLVIKPKLKLPLESVFNAPLFTILLGNVSV